MNLPVSSSDIENRDDTVVNKEDAHRDARGTVPLGS